jgi:hypothetical protein
METSRKRNWRKPFNAFSSPTNFKMKWRKHYSWSQLPISKLRSLTQPSTILINRLVSIGKLRSRLIPKGCSTKKWPSKIMIIQNFKRQSTNTSSLLLNSRRENRRTSLLLHQLIISSIDKHSAISISNNIKMLKKLWISILNLNGPIHHRKKINWIKLI